MDLSAQLLLSLSALGAVNALFLSLLFIVKRPGSLGNTFLGALLMMVGIRTFKSVLFFFNPDIGKIILQLGLSACFLIGPLLYFYCLSCTDKLEKQILDWRYHLGFICFLVVTVGLVWPYAQYPDLWGKVFYKIINYQWLVYLVLSGFVLKPVFVQVKKHNFNFVSFYSTKEAWVLSVYVGICMIWLAYYTASYTSYIVGAVSFSFLFYLLLLMYGAGMFRSTKENKEKYANKKIEQDVASEYVTKLEELMQKQAYYKDANLTLNKLSKPVGISPAVLSQLLNDNLDVSFSNYVNEFRISAAKARLLDEHSITMDVLAEEVGFNSQSTFYSAFRKVTGTTPAKFREKNQARTAES